MASVNPLRGSVAAGEGRNLARSTNRSETALVAATIVVAMALVFLRAPGLTAGRFYAEEGGVFFSFAAGHSFVRALCHVHQGYLSLLINLATGLAAAVPLEAAPSATTAMAALVPLVNLLLLLSALRQSPRFALHLCLGSAVILFSMPSEEVWLTTTTMQFPLAVGAAIVLVSPPAGIARCAAQCSFLVAAALTGMPTTLLAPFFWLAYARQRAASVLARAIAVSSAAALQLMIVARHPLASRPASTSLDHLLLAWAGKLVLVPLFGAWVSDAVAVRLQAASSGVHVTTVCMMIAALAPLVLLGVLARQRAWRAALLVACALWLVSISVMKGLGDPSRLVSYEYNGRYFYAPNALIGLALLDAGFVSPAPSRRVRLALRVLLCWTLAVGSIRFFTPSWQLEPGPDWRSEVALYRADPLEVLRIWPPGWVVDLSGGRAHERTLRCRWQRPATAPVVDDSLPLAGAAEDDFEVGSSIGVEGWARATDPAAPPVRVLAFQDARFLCGGTPNRKRPDLDSAERTGATSGFVVLLPPAKLNRDGGPIELFATFDGAAMKRIGALPLPHG